MDERSGSGKLVIFILFVIVALGAWYFFGYHGAGETVAESIDETVDVFVPDKKEWNRRTSAVAEARRVTDAINARRSDDQQ